MARKSPQQGAPSPSVKPVVVDRTWRSNDRQYLVDELLDEPGAAYRIWDSEGAPLAEARDQDELRRLLTDLGVDLAQLEQVPVDDPWCE